MSIAPIVRLVLTGFLGTLVACGGSSDDDDGPSGGAGSAATATYSGSIAFISLPAEDDETGADVRVEVTRGNESASGVTDGQGSFSIADGPSGDVTIGLGSEANSCGRFFPFPDVVDGSRVSLLDISFDCASPEGQPDATFVQGIRETFRGIVASAEPLGGDRSNVRVCVSSGGQNVVRLLRNVDQNPFGQLPIFTAGDLVEIDGARDFADSPSSEIEVVVTAEVISQGETNPCSP